MQKKSTKVEERITHLTLYRDDIEDIYDLLYQLSNKISFEVNEYTLDSTAELDNLRRSKIEKFSMRIWEPYMSISFDYYGAFVMSDNKDLATEGLTYKVLNILNKRRKKIFEFVDKKLLQIGLILMGLSSFMLIFYETFNPIIFVGFPSLILGCIALLTCLFVSVTKLDESRYFLSYKKNAPSFFERNKDEIIIGIIMLIAGVVVGKIF